MTCSRYAKRVAAICTRRAADDGYAGETVNTISLVPLNLTQLLKRGRARLSSWCLSKYASCRNFVLNRDFTKDVPFEKPVTKRTVRRDHAIQNRHRADRCAGIAYQIPLA